MLAPVLTQQPNIYVATSCVVTVSQSHKRGNLLHDMCHEPLTTHMARVCCQRRGHLPVCSRHTPLLPCQQRAIEQRLHWHDTQPRAAALGCCYVRRSQGGVAVLDVFQHAGTGERLCVQWLQGGGQAEALQCPCEVTQPCSGNVVVRRSSSSSTNRHVSCVSHKKVSLEMESRTHAIIDHLCNRE